MSKNSQIIYIVDDDDAVRDSLRALFESCDFEVRDFASGSAFLAEPMASLNGCLVLDLHLPVVGGFEVLTRVRAAGRNDLPVIVITGRGDATTRRRLLEAGANAYMEKPLDGTALVTAATDLMQ